MNKSVFLVMGLWSSEASGSFEYCFAAFGQAVDAEAAAFVMNDLLKLAETNFIEALKLAEDLHFKVDQHDFQADCFVVRQMPVY